VTKAEDRELRQAFIRWDRSTAYGRAQRDRVYDQAAQLRAKADYDAVRDRIFG
jgi:hypothetical protein